jgi:hypothetical protein
VNQVYSLHCSWIVWRHLSSADDARVAIAACGGFVPLHHHCLFKRGVPLGELWQLTELAGWLRSRGRTSFLLTAPPLRLPGAVGSPVTPVATV